MPKLGLTYKLGLFFIEHLNGKALFHTGKTSTSQSLHLYTDASNLGFGCTFGRKWFYGPFQEHWLAYHISVRKFFPIVLAMELWGEELSNTSVVLHSDNCAVVHVINKNSSKDPNLMKLMRRLRVHLLNSTFISMLNISQAFIILHQIFSIGCRYKDSKYSIPTWK